MSKSELSPIVSRKLAETMVKSTLDMAKSGSLTQRLYSLLVMEGAVEQSGEGGILYPFENILVRKLVGLFGFGEQEIENAKNIGRRIEITLSENRLRG